VRPRRTRSRTKSVQNGAALDSPTPSPNTSCRPSFNPGGDYHILAHDPARVANLDVGGVEPEVEPLAGERPAEKCLHPLVNVLAELGGLALAHPTKPKRPHEVVDFPSASPLFRTNSNSAMLCSAIAGLLRPGRCLSNPIVTELRGDHPLLIRRNLHHNVGHYPQTSGLTLGAQVPLPCPRFSESHFPWCSWKPACGVPVIASRCELEPEEILDHRSYGLLYNPGDVEALTRQLRIVLDEPAVASRLGRAGSQRAEEFSQDTILPEIERHIAALLV